MENLAFFHNYLSKMRLPEGFSLQQIDTNENCCVVFVGTENVSGEIMIGNSRFKKDQGLAALCFLDLKSGENQEPFGITDLIKDPTDLAEFFVKVQKKIAEIEGGY